MTDREPDRRPGGKRARTRRQLIETTLEVVKEKGFAGASLEEIARRAGMSRGAIYSNFASRAELVVAAASERFMQLDRDFTRPEPLKAQLRRFAQSLVAALPEVTDTGPMIIEFQLYAVTDPDLRARISESYAAGFALIAGQFEAQHGAALRMSARSLALAMQALAMGLVWQHLVTPQELSEADVLASFDALADGALRPEVGP